MPSEQQEPLELTITAEAEGQEVIPAEDLPEEMGPSPAAVAAGPEPQPAQLAALAEMVDAPRLRFGFMDSAYLEYRTEDGLIVNAIVWDGEAPYDPGEGRAVVPRGDSEAWIGWTYNADTGEFTPPADE